MIWADSIEARRGADGPTRPADVKRIRDSARYTFFEITISEGRNRQDQGRAHDTKAGAGRRDHGDSR